MVKKTSNAKVSKQTDGSSGEKDIKSLLTSLANNKLKVASEDEHRMVMNRMRTEYRRLAVRNLLEKKRLDQLQSETIVVATKNVDIKKELEGVRLEHTSTGTKLQKLQSLSQQLSGRLKIADQKCNADIKAEKEHRLELSNSFSASIKEISVQLEFLGQRRENILQENTRLKNILRLYLEEFDKDREIEEVEEESPSEKMSEVEGVQQAPTPSVAAEAEHDAKEAEDEGEDSGDEASLHDLDAQQPDDDKQGADGDGPTLEEAIGAFAAATEAAAEPVLVVEEVMVEAPVPLTEEEKSEQAKRLQEAADNAKIEKLVTEEVALRKQTQEYMSVFDSFQKRLTESNAVFTQKQNAIESLTKEIRQLEKENKQYASKIAELNKSNSSFILGNERLQSERDKLVRAADKYQELIDTFQAEVSSLEKKAAAVTK